MTTEPMTPARIVVDQLMPTTKKWANGRFNVACHLTVDGDNIEALHVFAESIGLKRSWFQNRKHYPHYDLTPNKREQAVRAGAIEIDRHEVVRILRANMAKDGLNAV